MTKTLDIPPQVIERARELTHAATDEEAILLALEAFNARGEAIAAAPPDEWRPQSVADLRRYFGTFKDFMTIDELNAMREMD